MSGGFTGAAINVEEVYSHLVRDLHAGTYSTPGFQHALHNARLMEAVRRAAERGERQKLLEPIESFDEARVKIRSGVFANPGGNSRIYAYLGGIRRARNGF